jgi:ABC-type antimicrobial peptide transport system permease subunit
MSNHPAHFSPPRFAEKLLTRLYPDKGAYSTAGDMSEEFQRLAEEEGTGRARSWYRRQVLQSAPVALSELITWRFSMFKNYLKIAWRHMNRQKAYSAINIGGLAISMACALLIVLWVRDELSFDKFNANKNEIYRVTAVGKTFAGFSSPAPFAPAVAAEIPEVTAAVRVQQIFGRVYLKTGDRAFYEDNGICADPELFTMFTFPLMKGSSASALSGPNLVVLSESLARKYFGAEDPINQTLILEGRWPLTVSAVMADIPRNSHFRFDFVVPMKFVEDGKWWGMEWGDFNFRTYIRTKFGVDEKTLTAKLNQVAVAHKCPQVVYKQVAFGVQPLADIYLNPLGGYDMPLGDKKYVYLFSLIALFISLIAGINFINLTTARAEKRAKEVGLRKVVGADRRQIINQFFGESTLVTGLALVLAIVLAKIAMPVFNSLTGKQLVLHLFDPGVLLSLGGIACLVGLLAGAFPSLYLSSFQPAQIFRGRSSGWVKKGSLRRILVVAQFSISIALILATVVVLNQMSFIRQKSWTSGQDAMLYIPFKENIGSKYDLVRSKLLEHPLISAVGAKDALPTFVNNNTTGVSWDGKTEDQKSVHMETIGVDFHYLKTMGLEIVDGRGFSPEFSGDIGKAFILSEEAVRQARLKNPVGKSFRLYGSAGTIVGVVKDSYFQSFRRELMPQVFYLFRNLPAQSSDLGVILIRVKGAVAGRPLSDVIAHIGKVWTSVNTSAPFEFHFFDQTLAAQYAGERRQGQLFGAFAFLAIFISCLGLFGLASFVAEQRTREIGIRKTLGASVSHIIFLLSKDFTKAVLIANLIAWPVAWIAMNRWLQNFTFRISLPLWIFLAAGGAALLLSWLTVGLQTLRSARMNPVDSLRYE